MASLIIESPAQKVKAGTKGQIIVSTNVTGFFTLLNGLSASIYTNGFFDGNYEKNLVWRGSTTFDKTGNATIDLYWPVSPGKFVIEVKSINMMGKEMDFSTTVLEVIE